MRMPPSGCSISVVCMFWEHEGRVRFSAPRQRYSRRCGISLVVELQFSKLLARVRFSYPAHMKKSTHNECSFSYVYLNTTGTLTCLSFAGSPEGLSFLNTTNPLVTPCGTVNVISPVNGTMFVVIQSPCAFT